MGGRGTGSEVDGWAECGVLSGCGTVAYYAAPPLLAPPLLGMQPFQTFAMWEPPGGVSPTHNDSASVKPRSMAFNTPPLSKARTRMHANQGGFFVPPTLPLLRHTLPARSGAPCTMTRHTPSGLGTSAITQTKRQVWIHVGRSKFEIRRGSSGFS
eukprot:359745-Chlamydomonas_euryale.AAC.3